MKNNKGITLIALTITFIVLIILLAIVTNLNIDDSLITKTKNSVEKINNQTAQEKNQDDYLIREWEELES